MGRIFAALALATALAACGGGASSSGAGTTAPPPTRRADPGPPAISEPGGLPPGYRLVFSDEFDVAGLPDATKWDYDTDRNRDGWYNNELQYYARARAENSRVENGNLIIEARREDLTTAADWGGQHYTSARLVTRGKRDWTYGYIEVRAKLPCGRGSWPAIWTLATPPAEWPGDGEIDIMEQVGFDPTTIHGTVHTGAYNHVNQTHRTATTQLSDACSAFHRYQATWTADRITIGVDDLNYYSFYNEGSGNAAWPFDSPQYLLLNLAVGGNWGGAQGIDDTIFPLRMEVDYVRVYQR